MGKWDQYVVPDSTAKKWNQYAVQPGTPSAQPPTPELSYGERVDAVTDAAKKRIIAALAGVVGDPMVVLGRGAPELANAAAQGVGSLFAPATELPGVAGTTAKAVLGAIPEAGKFLTNAAVQGLSEQGRAMGVPQALKAILPASAYQAFPPAEREKAKQSYQELASNAATALVGMGASKAIGKVPEKISSAAENAALRLESSAMKQSFQGEKGIIPFDRQARTALQKYGYSPTRSGFKKVGSDLTIVNKNAKTIAVRAEKLRGATVDLSEPTVQAFVDSEVAKAKNSAAKTEIANAFADVKTRVSEVASQYPDGKVPLSAAIELKNSLQDLAEKFDTPTNDLTMKQLAHTQMWKKVLNDITSEEPLLRSIGRKQRDLIELKNTLEKRVAQQSRADLLSWRMARAIAAGGGIGYVAGGEAGAVAGMFAELALDNPSLKHWTGVTLQRVSNLTKSMKKP